MCVSPSGRKPVAHGASHGKRAGSTSPGRGERAILVSRVQLQTVFFRPCRGWRFGARVPIAGAMACSLAPLPGLAVHISVVLAYRYARLYSMGAHSGSSRTSRSRTRGGLTRAPRSRSMANVADFDMADELLSVSPQQIPEKMYFRVGEASRLVGVPTHVLRFWEKQFSAVSPRKSGRGHRLYRRKDVVLFLEIKDLLYAKRFTIEGARKALRSKVKVVERKPARGASQVSLFPSSPGGLGEIRRELEEILGMLK